jgi:hypothetical protein
MSLHRPGQGLYHFLTSINVDLLDCIRALHECGCNGPLDREVIGT